MSSEETSSADPDWDEDLPDLDKAFSELEESAHGSIDLPPVSSTHSAKGKMGGVVKRGIVVGEDAHHTYEPPEDETDGEGEEDALSPLPAEATSEEASDDAESLITPKAPHGKPRRKKKWKRELANEESWTGESRNSGWFVVAGLVAMVVIACFLVAFSKRGSKVPPVIKPPPPRVVERPDDDLDDIPIAKFIEGSGTAIETLTRLLEAVEASEGNELAEMLRGGKTSLDLFGKWRKAHPDLGTRHPKSDLQVHALAIGSTGYLMLTGFNEDHLPAIAYFVKEEGTYRYDWQASEAYGEVLPETVEELVDDTPKLMRAMVSVSNLYTPQFPEGEYQCYTLHRSDREKYVWAYAKAGSDAANGLKNTIRLGRLGGAEFRATLRVRKGPEGSRPNQVEVVEFCHINWLEPEPES